MHLKQSIFSDLFLTILFFSGCLLVSFSHKEAKHCKITKQIVQEYLNEFTAPRQLELTGYGGAMMNDVQKISLNFLSFEKLDIEKSRILYINLMKEFLNRINCDTRIRPFLHEFPFCVKNIDLIIDFEDSERKIMPDGHVAMVVMGKNLIIHYDAYDPGGKGFYSLHREPYEEAVQLVKQRSFDLRNSGADKPRDLLLNLSSMQY